MLSMFNSSRPYRTSRMRALVIACILLGSFAFVAAPSAQQTPPGELVRTAIQNEMNDDARLHLFSWKEHNINRDKGDRVEYLVDTPQGILSRVVLIDGKPLTPEQRRAEDERTRKMLDPAQMRRKHKEQQEDDARTRKMLAAIPDAFDFVYLDSSTAPTATNSLTSSSPLVPASIRQAARLWSSPECRAKWWWTRPPTAWQKSTARSSRT